MKVLIACEESQAVCSAMRELGHEAYSCDIQECSGGHPEWHIKGDALNVINGNCSFIDQLGGQHMIDGKWDLLIAHPPCTDLAVSGARHFEKKREDGRQLESIKFFKAMLDADCDHVAVENPVNIIGGDYVKEWFPEYANLPKCTQIIQPYMFGARTKKTTCLWLKGLSPLTATEIVEPVLVHGTRKDGTDYTFGAGFDMSRDENGKIISWNDPRTARLRSKTFPGIAKAMAEQWAGDIR